MSFVNLGKWQMVRVNRSPHLYMYDTLK